MFRKFTAIIACLTLLFCSACSEATPDSTEPTTEPATVAPETAEVSTETTTAPTEEEEERPGMIFSPIDPEKPVVEAYTNELTIDNPAYTYRCSIPQIQCDSTYAETVNQELAEYYTAFTEEDGTWQGGNVSYDHYVNDDILTLVVYFYDTEQPLDYEADYRHIIYSLRMSDGSEVTTDEILQAVGVSKEDFRARAQQILGNEYLLRGLPDVALQTILDAPEDSRNNYNLMQFIATVNNENLDQLVPFLAEEGELRFIGRVYYIAGGFDYKTPIFSYFDDFEISPYYEDILKLC